MGGLNEEGLPFPSYGTGRKGPVKLDGSTLFTAASRLPTS